MFHRSCCTLEQIRFGGKMLHLVFASLFIVILANVVATIVVSATATRFRRLTLGRALQRSPGVEIRPNGGSSPLCFDSYWSERRPFGKNSSVMPKAETFTTETKPTDSALRLEVFSQSLVPTS